MVSDSRHKIGNSLDTQFAIQKPNVTRMATNKFQATEQVKGISKLINDHQRLGSSMEDDAGHTQSKYRKRMGQMSN